MADRAGRRGRRQGWRSRPLRARRARIASACRRPASSRRSAIPQDQRKISLIAVHAHGIPDEFPARRAGRGAEARAADGSQSRTDLRDLDSPHHRSRRCARPRRCRPRRARRRPAATAAAGSCTSPSPTSPTTCGPARRLDREAQHARQLGLLPRPRRADAARADLQRPVLAAGSGRSGPASPRAWCSTSTATRRATPSCAP